MSQADEAAEAGVSDSELIESLTDHLKGEYAKVADKLANELGIAAADEKKADADAETDAKPTPPANNDDENKLDGGL